MHEISAPLDFFLFERSSALRDLGISDIRKLAEQPHLLSNIACVV